MKRITVLTVTLLLICALIGCKNNNSGSVPKWGEQSVNDTLRDKGYTEANAEQLPTKQIKELEELKVIDSKSISIVSFNYQDENRKSHNYWIDFDHNQIEYGGNWYEVDVESMVIQRIGMPL